MLLIQAIRLVAIPKKCAKCTVSQPGGSSSPPNLDLDRPRSSWYAFWFHNSISPKTLHGFVYVLLHCLLSVCVIAFHEFAMFQQPALILRHLTHPHCFCVVLSCLVCTLFPKLEAVLLCFKVGRCPRCSVVFLFIYKLVRLSTIFSSIEYGFSRRLISPRPS